MCFVRRNGVKPSNKRGILLIIFYDIDSYVASNPRVDTLYRNNERARSPYRSATISGKSYTSHT